MAIDIRRYEGNQLTASGGDEKTTVGGDLQTGFYKEPAPGLQPSSGFNFYEAATGSKKWIWWIVGIAALAAIAYGGWYYYKKAK